MTRRLFVIPIVHAEADLGRVAASIRAREGEKTWAHKQGLVREAWERIARWCERVDPDGLCVFQDGLPDDPSAPRIVTDLAAQGSLNHRALQRLVDRGARLVGTERPDLLLREYELIRAAAHAIEHEQPADDATSARSAALLDARDQAIAAKIDATLQPGDRGVLFIGMLHDVESKLPRDIELTFPLGRPDASVQPSHREKETGS